MRMEAIDPHAAGIHLWNQWVSEKRPLPQLAQGADAIAARLQELGDPRAAEWRSRAAECSAASHPVALPQTAQRSDFMADFVALCHFCFAIVPIGAILLATFGLDAILTATSHPADRVNHMDLIPFKIGLVIAGFMIWGLGEAIILSLSAAARRSRQAVSNLVSVLIVVGLALMIFAWAWTLSL